MMPEEICDIVIPQVKRLSEKYAKTAFIVNSVIHTNNRQLNTHIDQLNYYLKSGVDSLPNVFFLILMAFCAAWMGVTSTRITLELKCISITMLFRTSNAILLRF